jgi:hypothetical protein
VNKEQVTTALNTAADLVRAVMVPDDHEDSDTVLLDDTLNLLVNTAGYLLDHPGASLDEVIVQCYGGGDVALTAFYGMPEDRKPARGSAEWDAAVIEEVRGWLA